ncbi:hypothetical protein DY124_06125 [Apilactobacillus micheneri]|uniref:hypothetical protein n=1 Tax=Apilactobacillus micheneri TaxID=1899430 RepID=UPI001126CEF4|nr:hypothetical protein [Apilactobacillus micheneri]TPR43151.1 hypothetical protein DY124_06125 [Apilactobacillus micheneri]TPR47239.1 hypothetical protein DY125_06620 [Apilactobacillus micheneri]
MAISVKPISNRAIEHYLKEDGNANIAWNAFINGYANIPFADVMNMTAPELSIYVYAMNKRNKNQYDLYSNMLGGG